MMNALVVYGSERGGTAGLAELIAAAFRDEGWAADVYDAAEGAGGGVGDADIAVVGGALYMNHWHKAARRFVKANAATLRGTPTWLFSSGPLDDSARAGDLAPVPQVIELARRIEARGHMTFGGRLEPNAKGFMARSMARKNAGDWRNSTHVAEWVHQICHEFLPAEIVLPDTAEEGRGMRIPAQRRGSRAPVTT
jgi:menaquinone-dependent protoporphyrinogen oxidase